MASPEIVQKDTETAGQKTFSTYNYTNRINKTLRYKTLDDVLADPDSNTSKLKQLEIATINSNEMPYEIEEIYENWEKIEEADLDRQKIQTLWER